MQLCAQVSNMGTYNVNQGKNLNSRNKIKYNTNDAMMDRDSDIEGKRLCTHDKYFVVNYPCINQKN